VVVLLLAAVADCAAIGERITELLSFEYLLA